MTKLERLLEDPNEKEFLEHYNPGDYPRPSVTSDIVIFTVDPAGMLLIVLIRRGGRPYRHYFALPGGFLQAGKESVYECAKRELKEETGLSDVFLEQLKTYSAPDRDPRMHVISVAHYAFIPYSKINLKAGDDASDAALFRILNYNFIDRPYPYQFYSIGDVGIHEKGFTFDDEHLAFDHGQIILDAIKRINGRKDYCLDLFELLENKDEFTIYDFKKIYEAVSFKNVDNANFRKMFTARYLKTGIVQSLGYKSKTGKPAMLYSFKGGK